MTAFKSLARVHTWVLNEKRQKLAGIEELIDKMRDDLRGLEDDLRSEERAAMGSIEGSVAFPAFIAATLERRRRLRQTIAELDEAAEAAREEVHAAFEEMKKFEHAHEARERAEHEERARREQAALDQLGAGIHQRGCTAGEE